VLRETAEETDIELKLQDFTYLFNDPNFNCDVYMTKLQKNQIPQQTEPEK
jgi:ADP-ribose pyrophosphatase YjhB (NUDIX family)